VTLNKHDIVIGSWKSYQPLFVDGLIKLL